MRLIVFMAAFACALALACGLSPNTAQAQKIMEEYKKPMPKFEPLSGKALEDITQLVHEAPFGDTSLAFEIRVPREWKKDAEIGSVSASLSSSLLSELARYYGPFQESRRSFLKVQAMDLEFGFSAEQWLLKYLLSFNYTTQGFAVMDRSRAEAIYVRVEQDQEYVVRAVASVSGKRIFLAEYFLPSEMWDQEKALQGGVVRSLQLQERKEVISEEMLPYPFLDIAVMEYPKSWTMRAKPFRSLDRLDVALLNVAEHEDGTSMRKIKQLNGKMSVSLVSYYATDSLDAELERLKAEFTQAGLTLKDKIKGPDDMRYSDVFEFANLDVYQAVDAQTGKAGYEAWSVAMGQGDYYYFVTLMTPSREEDYFLWVRNTESFRRVVASLHPKALEGKPPAQAE